MSLLHPRTASWLITNRHSISALLWYVYIYTHTNTKHKHTHTHMYVRVCAHLGVVQRVATVWEANCSIVWCSSCSSCRRNSPSLQQSMAQVAVRGRKKNACYIM